MKKTILTLFTIIIIVVTILIVRYSSYKVEYNAILRENSEFEQYKDGEINGIELATLINKTIDKNTKNKVDKNDKGLFIPNEENSIEIEIYMKDNEQTYKIETFYNSGMDQFIKFYRNENFKCSKIEYHKDTGRIKYLLFEQIVTS